MSYFAHFQGGVCARGGGSSVPWRKRNNLGLNLLPSGYELLLGQWTNASNVSFQYLSTPRYTSQCLNGTCGQEGGAEDGTTIYSVEGKHQIRGLSS